MDNENNTLKAPTGAELKRLKDFLIWAKENEIQLQDVDFGCIKLTLNNFEEVGVVEEPYKFQPSPLPEPETMYDEIAKRRGVNL